MFGFTSDDVCMVTGGNGGIGREVTAGLMEHGAHVVMACRNMARCQEAREVLQERNLPGTAECMQLDVANMASVRSFAAQLGKHMRRGRRRLRVLVNNAGVMAVPPDADGPDGHLRPNHFGPFLLTCLLLPYMGPQSRIVNVGSRAHKQGSIKFDKQGRIVGNPLTWYSAYARSKLCNSLFTYELARRFKASNAGISAYCVSPGRVNTNIFASMPGCMRPIVEWLAKWTFQTPKQGARTVLYAATAPELEGQSVLYLHDCKAEVPSRAARDPGLATSLWQASLEFVG